MRKAELELEIKSLTLRQRLEQQKLQLKQDEDRLRLKTELTNIIKDEILSETKYYQNCKTLNSEMTVLRGHYVVESV